MSADEEPLFHYSRLSPKLQSILSPGATLTCAVVHPRYLVRARRAAILAATRACVRASQRPCATLLPAPPFFPARALQAVGTSTGTVHVLELSGANAGGDARPRLQVSASGARLNDLCCEISVRRAAAAARAAAC